MLDYLCALKRGKAPLYSEEQELIQTAEKSTFEIRCFTLVP